MTRKIDSSASFLSFPLLDANSDKGSSSYRYRPRRRPSPIDLYELSTLEALPTPAPSTAPSHDSQSLDIPILAPAERRTRRLRKQASGHEMRDGDREMDLPKRTKDKTASIKQASSFLPMDEDVKAKPKSKSKPSKPTSLPVPPRPTPRQRPVPLDPSIFGRSLQVVRAEDPIEQVLRLQKEDEKRQRERSFTPALHLDRPPSRQRGKTIAHQPTASVSSGRTLSGSMRQRHHHLPMPSIQGVIEGDETSADTGLDRRDTLRLPITRPPASGGDHLQRLESRRPSSIHSTHSERSPVSPPSSPIRNHFYPGSGDAVAPQPPLGRPPTYFSRRSPITPTGPVTDDVPPLPAAPASAPALPTKIARHHSLTPSTTSQTDHAWRSSRHVEPDEERLTALEILEELNDGLEEGWEFGVLAKERSQAGLDKPDRSSRRYGMAALPSIGSTGTSFTISMEHHAAPEREGSIKDVRSWREIRKKSRDHRPASEQHRTRSLRPQRSAEGLEPLYEVSYTVNPDPDPVRDERPLPPPQRPPIPPRAPGRTASQIKLEVHRFDPSRATIDVPIVLDSPIKETAMGEPATRVEDVPYSVPMSPAGSPTPIHLRPLPPLPNMAPHHTHKAPKLINPLASLKHADGISRLLRPSSKRGSTSPRPPVVPMPHHSTPPSFTEPLSPLDSPPPASPRRRLSAREEPHAALPQRQSQQSFAIDRAQSRKQGMTALSFLALEDPTLSYSKASTGVTSNRNSLDMALGSRRRESVQAHIIPPEELAKLYARRRSSSASESGMSRESMMLKEEQEEILQDGAERDRQDARKSFGLSPPPRHHRRSFEPPPRSDEDHIPLSLSPPPPPRLRNSLSGRRPSPTPSPVYIDTAPQLTLDSYLDISPSPSPYTHTPVTPEQTRPPRRLGSASSHDAANLGHAAELRGIDADPPAREMERQALNDWLAQPRARKASVPVNGISRIRQGVYV